MKTKKAAAAVKTKKKQKRLKVKPEAKTVPPTETAAPTKGGLGGVLGGVVGDRYTVAAATYPPTVQGAVGIGARLKWGRERKQLSSRPVADHIGLSPEALTYYERDKSVRSMSVDKAEKCARYLGLEFLWFCLGIGDPFLDGEVDGVVHSRAEQWQAIRDTRRMLGCPEEPEGSAGVDAELTKLGLGIGSTNRRRRG